MERNNTSFVAIADLQMLIIASKLHLVIDASLIVYLVSLPVTWTIHGPENTFWYLIKEYDPYIYHWQFNAAGNYSNLLALTYLGQIEFHY